MIIGIDARFAVYNRRGIGNYTFKLIQHLAGIDRCNEYILYVDRDDAENVLPKQSNFRIKKLFPLNYLIWEQIALPIQARKDSVNILHCTGNTAPIYLDRKINLVSSIMDVMYLKSYSDLPKSSSLYQRLGRIYRKVIVPKTLSHISRVITISNYSKDDILKHFLALREGEIVVTYLAADERFHVVDKSILAEIKNKLGISGSYILSLGATDPRKNTELIIKTFIELKNQNKIEEKLVIVGIPDWKNTRFYDIVQESNFENNVIFTDFISEDDLVLLYNGASIFLYPSLYEGFGMPVLEAMSCGVPVITSNITSMPEIAGDAAILINPRDPEELKSSILTVLNDEKLRNELRELGFKQAKKFSWRRMAEETLKVYQMCGKNA